MAKRERGGCLGSENMKPGRGLALCCWLEKQKEDGGTVWRRSGENAEEPQWQGLWEQKNSSRGRGAAGLVEIDFRVLFLCCLSPQISKLPLLFV